MRIAWLVIVTSWLALLYFYAAVALVVPPPTQQSSNAAVQTHCTEDSLCWSPLINGNHRGELTFLPDARPFRVLSSGPQRTMGTELIHP